jgi:hypothetical protein
MKTTLIYGAAMAFAGTLLACILYFAGFHDSLEKLKTAQTIGMVAGILIWVAGLFLGLRARRAEVPANEAFGYGRALGNGALISLWASLFGTLGHILYMTVINPDMRDLIVRGELAKMEEKGIPAAQIEQAEGMVRMMTGPIPQGIIVFIFSFVICFVLALIISAFVQRPESGPPRAG